MLDGAVAQNIHGALDAALNDEIRFLFKNFCGQLSEGRNPDEIIDKKTQHFSRGLQITLMAYERAKQTINEALTKND